MPDVSIFINKKTHPSPTPTTGAALYVLGGVDPATFDLFREVTHQGDDEPISNNTTPVELREKDVFFSIKKKLNPGSQ